MANYAVLHSNGYELRTIVNYLPTLEGAIAFCEDRVAAHLNTYDEGEGREVTRDTGTPTGATRYIVRIRTHTQLRLGCVMTISMWQRW